MRKILTGLLCAVAAVAAEAASLPFGYDAVEYIESTKSGKQYINTGYVPKKTTKVECVVNVADKQVTTHAVVFGAQTKSGGNTGNRNNMSFFAWFNRSSATAYNRGAQEQQGGPFGYDVKVRLVCKNLKAEWSLMDGRTLGSISNSGEIKDGDPDYPLYIFALDEPNGNKKPYPPLGHTYLAMKLYSFKIYEGDSPQPVHDFVPCVERATGKAGLYDTVEGKFYGNVGNGGDFLTAQPSGYWPVEYIESTKGGGQYIDTGYVHKENTKVVCEVNASKTQQSGSGWAAVFGACNGTWRNNAFAFFIKDYDSDGNRARYSRTMEEGFNGRSFPRDVRTKITCEGKIAKWSTSGGGEDSIELSNPDVRVDDGACPLLIFDKNKATSSGVVEDGSKAVMKLYSFKIYEGETLARDFVPCVETATGEAGLRDRVGGAFYRSKGPHHFNSSASLPFGRELTSGTYTFEESFMYVAPVTESALKIADGASVLLKIPAGVTVTLRGGDAQGRTGAGAGIEVPPTAALSVIGDGKLVAIGGNAANGSAGSAAPAGWVRDRADGTGTNYNRMPGTFITPSRDSLYFCNGGGGAGGDGGGGAGAGIGGKGGNGGAGGAGAASETKNWNVLDAFMTDGLPGGSGTSGGAGGEPGKITIAETLTVDVRSGGAGTSGGASGAGAGVNFSWPKEENRFYAAWGGGGGGGGGAGAAAEAGVGFGGVGGGGGGGGGSGALDFFTAINNFLAHDQYGAGGLGGQGASGNAAGNGESGKNKCGEEITINGTTGRTGRGGGDSQNWARPGGSGAGGAAGVNPPPEPILPPGYRRVECIESTRPESEHSGPYIDTGYHAKPDSRFVADIDTMLRVSDWPVFFGTAGKDDPGDAVLLRYCYEDGQASLNAWFCSTSTEWRRPMIGGFENKRITAELARGAVTVNGVRHSIPTVATPNPYQGNVYLFCGNLAGKPWRCQQMRLYSFKIYEGNALVRNYVPCVNASGVAGLYETVKGNFYTNAGTGAIKESLVVPYWDPVAQVTRSAVCEIITKDTSKLENGKWYAVTNSVECTHIDVNGSANLILCDGATLKTGTSNYSLLTAIKVAKGDSLAIHGQAGGTGALFAKGGINSAAIGNSEKEPGEGTITINGGVVTAQGDENGAGIGGGYKQGGGGTITINGGVVTATGGQHGAGIGGGWCGAGGTITINGGTVTAQGGEQGAGIGGGRYGVNGGTITINGGTVTATGGNKAVADVGGGCDCTSHGTLTINGGSVGANKLGPRPVNRNWELLQRVIVPTDGLLDPAGGLRIEGLPNYYGTVDIHPVNNQIHLWLPSSREGYLFMVSDGHQRRRYFAAVADRTVTATPIDAGFRVNGQDIVIMSDDGWNYDIETGLLTLNKQMDYVLEGIATNGQVRVAVDANANVTLSNALIGASSEVPTITVKDGCTLHLSVADGEIGYLPAGIGQPVIRGGKTVVERGVLCLWSDCSVPVDCAAGGFTVADDRIMSIGKNVDNLRYVKEYAPEEDDQILLVGQRCQLTVPSVSHATVLVGSQSLSMVITNGTPTDVGMIYDIMAGDTVAVLVIPDDGYVLRGPAAVQWFEINEDTILFPTDLPVAVEGLFVAYRTVTVDEVGNVAYGHAVAGAVLFDAIADRPETVGKGLYGEEWYVVTGEVDCASICVTTGTVNLILYPGAVLTLTGEDGEPGVGVMLDAHLNIYGCDLGNADGNDDDYYGESIGTLVAYGGAYAAGIGGGGEEVLDDVPGADAGWITVNGGQVIAWGGAFGAGIGGGAFGTGAYLEVNGGSVFAYAGYDADDIGGGSGGEDGVTVVRGGNVMGNSVEVKPLNDGEERLYRVYVVSEKFVRDDGKALTIEGLGGFGTADVFPNEDGAICLYLPDGEYEFTVDGVKYFAVVDGETATAAKEEKDDDDEEDESEEGESEERGGEVLGIVAGEKVEIRIRAEGGRTYRLKRVTFEDGKWVDGDVVWTATATDDIIMEESVILTLEDNNPPSGSCFYMVEEDE